MVNLREIADRLVEGRVCDCRSVVDSQGRRFLVKARDRRGLPRKGTRVGFVPNLRPFRGRDWALEVFSAESLDKVLATRS